MQNKIQRCRVSANTKFKKLKRNGLKEDCIPDRRFVIIIDAINESPEPTNPHAFSVKHLRPSWI